MTAFNCDCGACSQCLEAQGRTDAEAEARVRAAIRRGEWVRAAALLDDVEDMDALEQLIDEMGG